MADFSDFIFLYNHAKIIFNELTFTTRECRKD